MLKDKDKIFSNIYGFEDRSIKGSMKRGHWSETKKFLQKDQDLIIEDSSINLSIKECYNDIKSK